MVLRAVIIDDDLISLALIKKILTDNFFDLHIVACYTSAADAVAVLNTIRPDIVFADANLGSSDISEVLEILDYNPYVVFVTSSKEFAYRAFNYKTLDYILKPIEKDSFVNAINKVLQKIFSEEAHRNRYNIFASAKRKIITVSSVDRYDIIKVKKLLYCAAEGKYTTLKLTGGQKFLSSKNLSVYENLLLGNKMFVRVSRSHIVNMAHVVRINKKDGMYCEFSDGSTIPVSRRKTFTFNRFLNLME
jgi:two-component system LytT family response regulator